MTPIVSNWEERDLPGLLSLWPRCFGDRQYDFQMDAEIFQDRVRNSGAFSPEGAVVARVDGKMVGFALVTSPGAEPYSSLSVILVDPDFRRREIGSAMLAHAEKFLMGRGVRELRVGYQGNPISFCIGADVRTEAYDFLIKKGFRNTGRVSLWMEADLTAYRLPATIARSIEESADLNFGLCDDAHKERLRHFMKAQFPGGWEASVVGAMTGNAPYPVMIATSGTDIVGFAGPLRVSAKGTANFTGIGTHPDHRRRKIGSILFNLMCAEFCRRGATRSTLHTGLSNPAQAIYLGAGYRIMTLVDYSMVKRLPVPGSAEGMPAG